MLRDDGVRRRKVAIMHDDETSGQGRENREVLEILARAEEDVKYSRIAPIQETFSELRSLLLGGYKGEGRSREA